MLVSLFMYIKLLPLTNPDKRERLRESSHKNT